MPVVDRSTTLRRRSSLVMDSPTKAHSVPTKPLQLGHSSRKGDVVGEVIPDSEEEEDRQEQESQHRRVPLEEVVSASLEEMREVEELIVIQSETEDEFTSTHVFQTKITARNVDPFYMPTPSTSKRVPTLTTIINVDDSSDSEPELIQSRLVSPKKRTGRKMILTDSESDEENAGTNDGSVWTTDDAILTFDDGAGFRKPVMRVTTGPVESVPPFSSGATTTPVTKKMFFTDSTPSETPIPGGSTIIPAPDTSPVKGKGKGKAKPKVVSTPSVQSEPGTPSSVATKQKRITKKSIEEAAQRHRQEYAQNFFQLLNREVFQNGLSADTQLQWNNRLQTTAGKAHWERTMDGKEKSCIQLSPKILDCDERIRNTLSHEMCHLACWVINRRIKENHGNLWQGWAQKVMNARPDVEITTKHSYEIAYKFTWKCNKCDKIYGRHSKSIKPEECYCGVCKTGDLIPQFEEKTKDTPKVKADSRMASDITRDSPVSVGNALRVAPDTPSRLRPTNDVDTDTDEIEVLCVRYRGTTSKEDGDVGGIVQQISVIDLTGDD